MVADTKLYTTLGVNPDASDNEIKKAYRKLAMKYHPDKGGDPDKFKEISAAFEILSDPNKKNKYDRFGVTNDNQQPGMNPFDHMNVDPMDMFSQFFGGGHQRQQRPRKNTQTIQFGISLEDVYNGKVVKLKVERNIMCDPCKGNGSQDPLIRCEACKGVGIQTRIIQLGPGMIQKVQGKCPNCDGSGKTCVSVCSNCKGQGLTRQSHVIELNIPRGSEHGTSFVFENKGDYIPKQGYSNLEIVVKQKDHSRLTRKKNDLFMEQNIQLYDALFGLEQGYRHLDGKDYIFKLAEGQVVQYNSKYVATGMGLKTRSETGNLYITFHVIFPKHIKNINNEKTFTFDQMKNLFGNNVKAHPKGTHIILRETTTKHHEEESNSNENISECIQQ